MASQIFILNYILYFAVHCLSPTKYSLKIYKITIIIEKWILIYLILNGLIVIDPCILDLSK